MKKFDLQGECDFRDLSPAEIETACLYEYMRESQTLGDFLNAATDDKRKMATYGLVTPFFLNFTKEQQFVRLMLALGRAGFPKPWKGLSNMSQKTLGSLLAKSKERTMHRDKEAYPPIVIEDASVEFDHFGEIADEYYHWRLEPSEPGLIKK